MSSNSVYIAHVRATDQHIQTVSEHLSEVAEIAKKLAEKINVSEAGEIIGLLHDFGKYSAAFQDYIKSGTGLLNPDIDDDYVDAKAKKGKIDHSTAGAQWLWQELSKYGKNGEGKLCAQILALCIVSHHGRGLIDCLQLDGTNSFEKRIKKPDHHTHLFECTQNADQSIKDKAKFLADLSLVEGMFKQLRPVVNSASSVIIKQFYLGFWTRFLFSCLIDADRINSADFERPDQVKYRSQPVSWAIAIDRLEFFLDEQQKNNNGSPINAIRRSISDNCKNRATQAQSIYTLTVPTGGGKTYASLRFALHHANKHGLERIIYIIPFTSIIEQNAAAIRSAIEQIGDDCPWVLEHHSNLEPDQQSWHSKLVAENWDSPIIITTMVQFLETLFSGGTRGVRRLHQLANSAIIFDEIQTLPINCTHLFCNALNFLTIHAKTTAVLCTATQPLLNKLPEKTKASGQLQIPPENELVVDVSLLFKQLKRVEISNKTKPEGWSKEEITDLAISEFKEKGNCLVIVNTKVWAHALYMQCAETVEKESLFNLSTQQCSAHRSELFQKMRGRLTNNQPVLCISTQLIEAGVDIDFASVIRFLAGLDSIAQAAGRCNRNGRMETAIVHVVNPAKETIDQLIEIKVGQEKTKRVFDEVDGKDLLAPDVMARYFDYYFYDRAEQMNYPLTAQQVGRTDSLLNLLSENKSNIGKNASLHLKQSFMTAGAAFKAIDAPTYSVIVPYRQGKELIKDLCGIPKQFDAKRYFACLKQAQKYSVNVFPNVWNKLLEQQAVIEIQGEGIYYLDERYYSPEFGLSTEIVGKFEINIL